MVCYLYVKIVSDPWNLLNQYAIPTTLKENGGLFSKDCLRKLAKMEDNWKI
jgi:hypothetical protein